MKKIALLTLMASPAWASSETLTDSFGRTVSVTDDGQQRCYLVNDGHGNIFTDCFPEWITDQEALGTINSMAPPGN